MCVLYTYLLLVNLILITYQNLINDTDFNLIDIVVILYLLTNYNVNSYCIKLRYYNYII